MTCAYHPLKIDIIVHGRFHAFALGNALRAAGHDVLIHTNYPPSIVARFGFPADSVKSCLLHGLVSRALNKYGEVLQKHSIEPLIMRSFGEWSARSLRQDADIVYIFSGIAEEVLYSEKRHPNQLRILVRGSTHIRFQDQILSEEEKLCGKAVNRPSKWMIDREEREYELADRIAVLSGFAYRSFLTQKPEFANKVFINPLGVDCQRFAASSTVVAERSRRILSGDPLNVLSVGTFSYRKGVRDFVETARLLRGRANFRFVGDYPNETRELRKESIHFIQMLGRIDEKDLRAVYNDADIMLFPTLEDGFAAVLLQATANGLPIIATTNCAGSDFIVEGRSGWIVPIHDVNAIAQRIAWCDENREEYQRMVKGIERPNQHSWEMMADHLTAIYTRWRS